MIYFNKVCFYSLITIYFFATSTFTVVAQDNANDFYEKGYRYLTVDKQKAIDLLSQSILLDPNLAEAYFHRGITYFKLDQFDSAIVDFDKAYELKPSMDILWMYKGFAYRNKGDFKSALNAFGNYISLHPTDTSAYSYILRGKMKYELGDFNGAVDDYDMASKLKPFEEKYNYYKFVAFKEAGMQQAALKCVNNLIEVNPEFYGYYFYKGQLFQTMNYYDSAVFMFNVAILKNYQNPDSYFYRAQSYESLKEYEKALEDYNTAITLNQNDGTYFSKRGNCKYIVGNKEGACSDWNKAGDLGYYEDFDKVKSVCE